MPFHHRKLEPLLLKASKHFPAILLTGPRRSGKTTLLKKLFPKASYYLLEDPDLIARIHQDPRGFLEEVQTPAILDEVQNTPEIFNYLRTLLDRAPQKKGRYLLTGSQEAPLMRGVSESMAGRVALFQLLPFSLEESSKVSLLKGGFPEVIQKPSVSDIWFRSYIQTYLERDVRAITSIRSLSTFRRFLSLIASRIGQILNKADLAAPLGVSIPTISEWLNILEITGQIILLKPFYENFGKRLIKSPKIYFVDTGMACHLLGINSEKTLVGSPFLGALFESFVASELIKHRLHHNKANELYYFRDEQGLEVDFLINLGNKKLILAEAKATRTLNPDMASSLERLSSKISQYQVERFIIYRKKKTDEVEPSLTILKPGVKAVSLEKLINELS